MYHYSPVRKNNYLVILPIKSTCWIWFKVIKELLNFCLHFVSFVNFFTKRKMHSYPIFLDYACSSISTRIFYLNREYLLFRWLVLDARRGFIIYHAFQYFRNAANWNLPPWNTGVMQTWGNVFRESLSNVSKSGVTLTLLLGFYFVFVVSNSTLFNVFPVIWSMLGPCLTLFLPMFPFDPPENIRKPKVFWSF